MIRMVGSGHEEILGLGSLVSYYVLICCHARNYLHRHVVRFDKSHTRQLQHADDVNLRSVLKHDELFSFSHVQNWTWLEHLTSSGHSSVCK